MISEGLINARSPRSIYSKKKARNGGNEKAGNKEVIRTFVILEIIRRKEVKLEQHRLNDYVVVFKGKTEKKKH